MKKRILPILTALILIALTGCPLLPGVSVEERMSMFVATINAGNYSNVKQHTSSSADDYTNADSDTWSTGFSSYGTILVTSTGSNSATCSGDGVTFSFTLDDVDEENDYRISRVIRNPGSFTIFD
jgi:hypothetical protein